MCVSNLLREWYMRVDRLLADSSTIINLRGMGEGEGKDEKEEEEERCAMCTLRDYLLSVLILYPLSFTQVWSLRYSRGLTTFHFFLRDSLKRPRPRPTKHFQSDRFFSLVLYCIVFFSHDRDSSDRARPMLGGIWPTFGYCWEYIDRMRCVHTAYLLHMASGT